MQNQPAPNRLRELREKRGLKLYDISHTFRVDPATVSRWEHGAIPSRVIPGLAHYFEVSAEYLMGWDQLAA